MDSMKIRTKDLSKETLVWMWDHMKPKSFSDLDMAKVARADKIGKAVKLEKKLKSLEKKMRAMKVSLRSSNKKLEGYNRIVVQYNRLNNQGRNLLDQIAEIEKAYPATKVKIS